MAIMGDVLMQDGPKPLDRVQVWAIGRQLDQVDATLRPRQKRSHIGPFVAGGIVPDDMDEAFVGVARLNFGKKLHGTDPVDGGWLDKRRIEGLKVERAMDVHTDSVRNLL